MGELKGKDIWHTKVKPYTGKHFVLVGKKPTGAILFKGPGSGYRTAFYYGERPKKPVRFNIGFEDAVLVPLDGRMRAYFAPSITISKRSSRLSESTLRLTPKSPRISQKPMRITR